MNNRMRTLIDALEIKKVDFARKLNISQSFVSDMCSGKSKPSDRTITDICREFKVSEEWLRTGKGEMFAPEPAFDLSEYANRHGMTALETEILKAYLELDPNTRESLLRHFKERLTSSAPAAISKTETTTPAPDTAGQERTGLDLAAELAELKRQNQEMIRQNQELAAEIAAMKEEERDEELAADFREAFSALQSGLAGNSDPAKRAKK